MSKSGIMKLFPSTFQLLEPMSEEDRDAVARLKKKYPPQFLARLFQDESPVHDHQPRPAGPVPALYWFGGQRPLSPTSSIDSRESAGSSHRNRDAASEITGSTSPIPSLAEHYATAEELMRRPLKRAATMSLRETPRHREIEIPKVIPAHWRQIEAQSAMRIRRAEEAKGVARREEMERSRDEYSNKELPAIPRERRSTLVLRGVPKRSEGSIEISRQPVTQQVEAAVQTEDPVEVSKQPEDPKESPKLPETPKDASKEPESPEEGSQPEAAEETPVQPDTPEQAPPQPEILQPTPKRLPIVPPPLPEPPKDLERFPEAPTEMVPFPDASRVITRHLSEVPEEPFIKDLPPSPKQAPEYSLSPVMPTTTSRRSTMRKISISTKPEVPRFKPYENPRPAPVPIGTRRGTVETTAPEEPSSPTTGTFTNISSSGLGKRTSLSLVRRASARLPQRQILAGVTYFCTTCGVAFKTRAGWEAHESFTHERQFHWPCPYIACEAAFDKGTSFQRHHEEAHACLNCTCAPEVKRELPAKKIWACGFDACKKVFDNWKRRCKHVAGHYEWAADHPGTTPQWRYTNYIRNLLRQSDTRDAFKRFMIRCHGDAKRAWPPLEWLEGNTYELRRSLEYRDFPRGPTEVVRYAYQLGHPSAIAAAKLMGAAAKNLPPSPPTEEDELQLQEVADSRRKRLSGLLQVPASKRASRELLLSPVGTGRVSPPSGATTPLSPLSPVDSCMSPRPRFRSRAASAAASTPGNRGAGKPMHSASSSRSELKKLASPPLSRSPSIMSGGSEFHSSVGGAVDIYSLSRPSSPVQPGSSRGRTMSPGPRPKTPKEIFRHVRNKSSAALRQPEGESPEMNFDLVFRQPIAVGR
ncbi:hypothetical protein EJ06DRAFT_528013 [Trichodelitschia bisporula]|uniref:C2H2-type domain-containing protein n=1 Tax=Trichodelitschia bisporula TaxID=703511 RepID=A0A6G1I4Q5_9PEZI|nr:hypothetical protein EJ06DRAFT_528013 [Trichodelitschia bisporula]